MNETNRNPIESVIAEIATLAKSWQGSDLAHAHRDTKLWPVGPQSAAFLEALVVLFQPKTVLELGTSGGYSTLHLARAAASYGGSVHTLEHDQQKATLAVGHFERAKVQDTIRLHNEDIFAALSTSKTLPPTFDFVFIDAEKAHYDRYFSLIKARLHDNALVIADNVTSHARQLEVFRERVFKDEDFLSYLWPFEAGLLISRYVSKK